MKMKTGLFLFIWALLKIRHISGGCTFAGQEGFECAAAGDCILLDWVCDGEVQCQHPDRSDEERGCQMFPETGCKSWYGKKYIKCPNGRCVQNENECAPSTGITPEEGGTSGPAPPSSCPSDHFACKSGLCILKNLTCDGVKHCDDKSDEIEGCNLFPNEGCHSWYGQRYVQCRNSSQGTVCTLPQFQDGLCRSCEKENNWRCNDGKCIPSVAVQNGIKDCQDGSDELAYVVKWWLVVIVTVTCALFGICLSFLCRFLNDKSNTFDCLSCRSKRKRLSGQCTKPTDPPSKCHKPFSQKCLSADSAGDQVEMVDYKVQSLQMKPSNQYDTMFKLVEVFELDDNWRKMSLAHREESNAQHLYSQIHQDCHLYKTLYRYLVYRMESPVDLARAVEQLFRWEKDFHGESNIEALACWRLHLGSSETLEQIVGSVEKPGMFSQVYQKYMPTKNKMRKARQSLPPSIRPVTEATYKVLNTIYYLIVPFIGASLFYFDLIKDMVFTAMTYRALADLTQENYSPANYPFETTVLVSMMVAIAVAQILFAVLASFYSNEVFEMCDHTSSVLKKQIFRVISFVCAPLMPAFVLANHVYYLRVEYTEKRVLQTLTGDCREAKLKVFQDLENYRYLAQMHRRFYSFFRVIAAATQSFTMIVGLVVIVVVTSRPDRKVELVAGVAEKIKDFLDVGSGGSLVENFDLVREIMLYSYLLFTTGMILTALTRYVRQCKNMSMSTGGKLFLSLYFLCHLVARLTLYIAMFSTAESTDETKPSFSLLPSAILGFIIFILHFIVIYFFKWKCVPNFQSSDVIERLVHVLINTLVAVPYMPWNVDKIQLDMKITALRLARRQSLPTPKTKGRLAPPLQKQNSASSFVFPNIVDALVAETGDLNEKITAWWWEDPSRNLSADEAVARSGESKVLSQMQDDSNIRETHKDLDKLGFINKELYNPQKTKMEYFWLIIFHFMFSGFALVLEIVNGGTYTKSGLYYSWDVRLGAFMMGIFFLLLYYKKYHPLRDLVSTSPCRPQYFCPIFCCCVKDDPLKSIPEEDVVRAFLAPPPPPTGILSPSGSDKGDGEESKSPEKETREIQTQTSLVSEKSVTSLANRKDGAKMTQQCATVAEEDTAVTRNESNEAAEVELPKIIVKER